MPDVAARLGLAGLREEAAERRLDLDDRRALVDLAAVGVAKLAWRNGPVEDWHSVRYRRIGQREMMRANASATRLVRDLLEPRIRAEQGPADDGRRPDVDARALFEQIGSAVADPDRRLPDGRALSEFAPSQDQFRHFCMDVQGHCREWTLQAEEYGLHRVTLALACEAGTGLCRRWWLGPDWPAIVEEFVARLDDPRRWEDQTMIDWTSRLERPVDLPGHCTLRALLLNGPDLLTAEWADYCLRAGLGAIIPRWWESSPPSARHIGVASSDG